MSQAYLVPGLDAVNSAIPLTINGLVQYAMDRPATYGSVVDGYPTITPLERKNPGVPRGARYYKFDGVDDVGSLNASVGVSTDITLTAWIKVPNYSVYNMIAVSALSAGGAGFDFRVDITSGRLAFFWNVAGIYSPSAVGTNTWMHVAATRAASGEAILYINGIQVASGTLSGTPVAGVMNNFSIGAFGSGFNGALSMYDVRAYSVVKTQSQIQAIYGQSSTPATIDTTGLLGLWPCQEESGIVGYDISGNGRNLTLTNITQSTFHATDSGVKWSYPNEKGHAYCVTMTNGSSTWDGAWLSQQTITGDGYAEFFLGDGNAVVGLTSDSDAQLIAAGAGIYSVVDFGLQLYSGIIRTWENNGYLDTAVTCVSGDVLRVTRTGTTVTISKNGSVVHTFSGASALPLRAFLLASTTSSYPVCMSINGSRPLTGTVIGSSVTIRDLVIPASLSTPANSAKSNVATNVTGPVALPATTEVPCFTGGGTAYVDLGSAFVPKSGDFELSVRTYIPSTVTTAYTVLIGQVDGGSWAQAFAIYYESGWKVFYGSYTSNATTLTGINLDAWNYIKIRKVGTTLFVSANEGAESSVTCLASIASTATTRLGYSVGGQWFPGRISDFQILQSGVTTYFPLQDGPGSSNTNRDIAYVKSDGTGGVISNALTNGTVSSIWANRCPYAEDWSVKYGGGVSSGVFIPGRIGSSNDAAGNAKTLSAGKVGNPYTRVVPNVWGAPSLNNIGYTSSMKLEEVPCFTGDGTNAHVAIPHIAGLDLTASTYEISFWCKPTNLKDLGNILWKNSWGVLTNAAGVIAYQYNNTLSSLSSPPGTLANGVWAFVRIVSDGTNMRMFVNGIQVASTAYVANGSNTNVLTIGYDYSHVRAFEGLISDLQITVGGDTICVPLTDGTGRDIAYYTNGTPTVVSNAVTNGSVSAIWANKTNGLFVPKYAIENIVPRNTKFRRTRTDGNDRYTAFINALTGSDLVKMLNYVR